MSGAAAGPSSFDVMARMGGHSSGGGHGDSVQTVVGIKGLEEASPLGQVDLAKAMQIGLFGIASMNEGILEKLFAPVQTSGISRKILGALLEHMGGHEDLGFGIGTGETSPLAGSLGDEGGHFGDDGGSNHGFSFLPDLGGQGMSYESDVSMAALGNLTPSIGRGEIDRSIGMAVG